MISRLEKFFIDYARSYFTGEPEFDRNIQLKLAHSFRVLALARKIAAADVPDDRTRCLIARAALLHDFGRFEQFKRFRTYNDAHSLDHGNLAAELTEQHHLLDDLNPGEHAETLAAIRCHNKLAIPDDLTPRGQQIAGAVRDADKIDIIPILLDYLEHPDNDSIVFNLTPNDRITPEVEEAIRAHRTPLHRDLKTVTDFIASKLLWVYDLNFPSARAEFARRAYLGKLLRHLPDTPQIRELYTEALNHITQ